MYSGEEVLKCTIDSFSDVGISRTNNEDAIEQCAPKGIAVLADGMGGHNAGEVASRQTVLGLVKGLTIYLESHMGAVDLDAVREHLSLLIAQQNKALFDQAQVDAHLEGMGCTLVVVCLMDAQALIANVGDSRCYHHRQGSLTQVTRDHSFVQFQLDHGYITEAEAHSGQSKNYLLRSVGTSEKVSPDFFVVDIQPEDTLLTCSDGLTEALSNEQLQEKINQALCGGQPARALVQAALDAGSRDNVSVQVMRISQNEATDAHIGPDIDQRAAGFWQKWFGRFK